jgi:hypothetical protein
MNGSLVYSNDNKGGTSSLNLQGNSSTFLSINSLLIGGQFSMHFYIKIMTVRDKQVLLEFTNADIATPDGNILI